jgi:hypothetical protein
VVDWNAVEALGTTGALLVTGTALLGQVRERRVAQASKVSAVFGGATGEGGGKHKVMVAISNRSDEPVYEVTAIIAGHMHHMPYGETRPLTLPGHGDAQYALPGVQEDPLGDWQRVGVHFRDASGRFWTRLPDGRLRDRTRAVRVLRWADRPGTQSRRGRLRRAAGYRIAGRLGRDWNW